MPPGARRSISASSKSEIAADVENGGIVGAFVVFRRRHFITDGAICSRAVFLPDDGGLSAGKKRKPGKEAAENSVAGDEDAGADVVAGEAHGTLSRPKRAARPFRRASL